jgi:hypothetical protein
MIVSNVVSVVEQKNMKTKQNLFFKKSVFGTTDNNINNKQLMYFVVLRNCGNCAYFVYISAAFSTGLT